jgi:tetratricopeptide (TPR) repeat protein
MNIREKILLCLFLISVFINFLGPIIDPDFPFHLKTGEYIYQHREIPKSDPFSFYDEGIITDRGKFTLSQYWISQIIFYKLYSLTGPPGIILLRAAVFSAFVFLLWFALRKRGFYSSLIISILVAIMLQSSKLDRPQIFSFLFTLILILLIEKFREKPESTTPLYLIPPLMLLWANMHAGVVFGIAIILIYALSEGLKLPINKFNFISRPLEKKSALIFFVIALSAILFSYVNPITNNQILMTLESHTEAKWLYESVREYMSPTEEMGSPFTSKISIASFWILFGFVSIIVVLNVMRTKSIDITVFVLILFSSVAAFTAVRYIPFFLAIALPLSRGYRFWEEISFIRDFKRSPVVFVLFSFIFIFAIAFGLRERQNMFQMGRHSDYPEGVANFLLSNRIEANMFNQNNKGSYLLWRLYPHYKIFNDTRYISLEAVIDSDIISFALEYYRQPLNSSLANALSPMVPERLGKINISSNDYQNNHKNKKSLWEKRLEEYNIDLIVHEACVPYTLKIYPLILRLIKDDEWVLIYMDGTMQIFVRNKEKYLEIIRKFRLPKELIYDEIILETAPLVSERVPTSSPYSSLAFALMMKGKDEDARKMIDAALELDKNDIVAHFCTAYLALKQKNSNNTTRLLHVTK